MGTRLPELQEEMLTKEEKFTLAQTVNNGRTHEVSINHILQLREMQSATDVHPIRTMNNSNCHSCSRSHTMNEICPAHGTTCK